jgi:Fe-S-cluster containining protein
MNNEFFKLLSSMTDDVSQGLLFTHARLNDNTKKILESTSFLYALIELLSEKGLLTIEELDERKRTVAARLVERFTKSGLGLVYQDPEYDKYTFEHTTDGDCQNRLHICQAICCKLPFALSRQDVEEGVIRWEFGKPYLIAHGDDGYCLHLDRKTWQCTVHQHRPVPCRGFTCEDNKKWQIWKDYEKLILDDDFDRRINKDNAAIYHGKGKLEESAG